MSNNRKFIGTQKKLTIPFYDEKGENIFENFSEVVNKRNKGFISYLYYKSKITILQALAQHCPINTFRVQLHKWRGVNIGQNVYIGQKVFIDNFYPNFVYLEDSVVINNESMILAHYNPPKRFQGLFESKADSVVIKRGAIVGVRGIVMPGVTIGECSVITAGTVVMKNVAPFTMVQGNPASKVLNFKHLLKQ